MASNVTITTRLESSTPIANISVTPRQVERIRRVVVNHIVRETHKKTGGVVPRKAGVTVVGYRRKRMFRTLARTRKRNVVGSVWIGTQDVAAKYGGVLRNTKDGARAGRHFFKGSFVRTMPNGYRSIWHKNDKGELVQDIIKVPDAHQPSLSAVMQTKSGASQILSRQIEKELAKNVR